MKKNHTLSFQIWKNFALSILILSIAFSFLFYIFMSNFIKDQIFQSIEFEQGRDLKDEAMYTNISKPENYQKRQPVVLNSTDILDLNKMEIGHIEIKEEPIKEKSEFVEAEKITELGIVEIKITDFLDEEIMKKIIAEADRQVNESERYSMKYQEKELLYVINKKSSSGNTKVNKAFSYSYVIKDIRKIIISQFKYLYFAIILIIISMLYPAKLVSNKITKPLDILKENMENIANRDWTNQVKVIGAAEIESLSHSCEEMRIQLIDHDKSHQMFLQEISHELKTPIMIINSYIQAIRDGIFKEDNIDKALNIIEKEMARLEKRSLDLIYITNLDFLKYKGMDKVNLNLKNELEAIQKDMSFLRNDITWDMNLEEIEAKVYDSVFITAIENILNNQVRYAKTKIKIKLFSDGKNINIEISNDGKPIELNKEKAFAPFEKGKDGKSGLGLYISKKILELHSGNISFENLEEGVIFYIKIPKKF